MSQRRLIATLLIVSLAPLARAQGPLVSYLTDPNTELAWASCSVSLEGGSRRRLPFLPLVSRAKRAPLGSDKYARDVRVDAPVVFVGDGVVAAGGADAYGSLDVAGKVVLFAYDAPGTSDAQPTLSRERYAVPSSSVGPD